MSVSSRIDTPNPRLWMIFSLTLFMAVAALGVSAWHLYYNEQQLIVLRREIRQLNNIAATQHDAKQLSEAILAENKAIHAQLVLLDSRINQTTSQYDVLNGMYQEITRSRSDWLLPEIEYTLTIANQQLQLAGNVPMAIVALDYLNKRLARADRPQLISVRKAVARDLDVLNALPKVDIVDLTVKLDNLIDNIDRLPLSIDMHRAESPSASLPFHPIPAWKQLLFDLTQSLSELVRIRRMDNPEAVLLSPDQSLLLRENLKIRLLDARLAIMQRDVTRFKADIAAVRQYVVRYYDGQAQLTQHWLATLNKLDHVPLNLTLPDLSVSLKVVRDAQGAGL